MKIQEAHDPAFDTDRKWMFACFDAQAVSYDVLKRQLRKAGLPKPSVAGHAYRARLVAGHAYRARLVAALEAGMRGEALVAEMKRPMEPSNTEMYFAALLNETNPNICRMAA